MFISFQLFFLEIQWFHLFHFVLLITVVLFCLFCSFCLFYLFHFGHFILLFQVLVHANLNNHNNLSFWLHHSYCHTFIIVIILQVFLPFLNSFPLYFIFWQCTVLKFQLILKFLIPFFFSSDFSFVIRGKRWTQTALNILDILGFGWTVQKFLLVIKSKREISSVKSNIWIHNLISVFARQNPPK